MKQVSFRTASSTGFPWFSVPSRWCGGCLARLAVAAMVSGAFSILPAQADEDAFLVSAEVTFDPPGDDGMQVVTVRMAPGVTRSYDKLRFECVYSQTAPWTNSAGIARTKTTYAPVHFVYERTDVRFTTELDSYVSFRFPIGEDDLRTRFGNNAFRQGVPIRVARILVTGIAKERALWTYALPTTPGLQPVTDAQRTDLAPAQPEPEPEKPSAGTGARRPRLGDIDLD